MGKIVNIILNLPYSNSRVNAYLSDVRDVPKLNVPTPGFVITSPPYINVFNYHQNYRNSVESLKYDVLRIAKQEFGSNRRNRGNRFNIVTEYCIDLSLSIQSILNIADDNTKFIFIVGRTSRVLSQNFYNSEIIYNIFSNIFGIKLELRQERHFKNKFENEVYEDILHFRGTSTKEYSNNQLIVYARQIAKETLLDTLMNNRDNVSNERQELLVDAINNVMNVNPSPIGEI